LVIEQELLALDSLAELKAAIGDSIPVVLVVTGKGLLEGVMKTQEVASWPEILHQRLPGADPAVFVGQLSQTPSRVSVLRKAALEEIQDTFDAEGIPLVNIYLGLTAITQVLPFLPDAQVLATAPYTLHIEDHRLIDFATLPEEHTATGIMIGEQVISSRLLLPLGAAIDRLIGHEPIAYGFPSDLGQDFERNQYTRILGLGGLGILFFALLINFFAYNQTARSLAQVEGELYYSQSLLSKMDSLKTQLSQRKTLLGDQPLRPTQLSLLADEIARTIPPEVNLLKLQCFPIEKPKTGERDARLAYAPYFLVQAKTSNTQSINDWILDLEAQTWLGSVKLQPFRNTQKDEGVFELRIEISRKE
jgi:Tfp pilus assembly protein PilN